MGRKAKLKKQRRQGSSSAIPKRKADFIKRVEQEGYQMDNIKRSPEVPRNDIEPQL